MTESRNNRLTTNTELALTIGGQTGTGDRTLKVYRVQGRETISESFRYVIDLVRVDADNDPLELTPEQVLGHSATLHIAVADGGSQMLRKVHGVIAEFIAEESLPGSRHTTETFSRYRLVLVPRLALLARNRQNRIHATAQPQTLEEIIRYKLLSQGPDYSADDRAHRILLADDEFRIDIDNEKLPLSALSHVAQHNESDFDFIRRVCESHGVYFFFAANTDDSSGMVVFGNTNSPFGTIRFETDPDNTPGEHTGTESGETPSHGAQRHRLEIELTLTGATGLVDGSQLTGAAGDEPARLQGALVSFTSVHRPAPRHVRVIDDQAAHSDVDLRRTATLDAHGWGVYTDYDTHFSTQASGDAFATIRSQELKAASNYHLGLTNSPCVAPGRTFRKTSADPNATDPHFLVTHVDIDVKQAHTDIITEIDGEPIQSGFTNRFRCVDFDADAELVYRPPRLTPIPRLPGVHTAYIATGLEDRPAPDEDGAYRIHHKFVDERDDVDIASRSRAVRKAEPYAGEGVGMHFPLKQDTEVLVAYRNGDPDRPVIAAAMPGPSDHASPVTDTNPTSHVLETSAGARFEIHDGYDDEQARMTLRSRESSELASYLRLGKADGNDASATLEDHYVSDVLSAEVGERDGIAMFTADDIREAAKGNKITEVRGTAHLHAEQHIRSRSLQHHLLRGERMLIVSGNVDEPESETLEIALDHQAFTVGEHDTLIAAERNIHMRADKNVHVVSFGDTEYESGGNVTRIFYQDIHTHVFADEHKLVTGSSSVMVLGAATSLVVGARTFGSVGGELTILGPVVGYLGFGFGAYMWPQISLFHGVLVTSTIEGMFVSHVRNEKESATFSIRHQVCRLYQSQVEARIDNLVARCMNSYTLL